MSSSHAVSHRRSWQAWAPFGLGNLQIMWPEGNAPIRRGMVDRGGGVPDYNARVRIEVL